MDRNGNGIFIEQRFEIETIVSLGKSLGRVRRGKEEACRYWSIRDSWDFWMLLKREVSKMEFSSERFEIKIAMVFLRSYFSLKMWRERRKMYTDIRANIALYYEPSQPLMRSKRRLMQADRKSNFYRGAIWNRNNRFSWKISWKSKKGEGSVSILEHPRFLGFLNARKARTKFRKWNFHRSGLKSK